VVLREHMVGLFAARTRYQRFTSHWYSPPGRRPALEAPIGTLEAAYARINVYDPWHP
jgi:hypothetical protein